MKQLLQRQPVITSIPPQPTVASIPAKRKSTSKDTGPIIKSIPPEQQKKDAAVAARTATVLERDLRDFMVDWRDAAKTGVENFTTGALASRIEELESGSVDSFVKGIAGNTLWALTCFIPGSGIAVKLLIFGVSEAGVALAAQPSIPLQKSESNVLRIAKLMQGKIFQLYERINFAELAKERVDLQIGVSRFEAINSFVASNFRKGLFTLRSDDVPKAAGDAIAAEFEKEAVNLWDRFKEQVEPLGGIKDEYKISLGWAKVGDSKYLVQMKSPWGEPHFIAFIDSGFKTAAISQLYANAKSDDVKRIPEYESTAIKEFPKEIPGTAAKDR
jgi:hypothetical protein